MHRLLFVLTFLLTGTLSWAQTPGPASRAPQQVAVGRLQTGATVSLVRVEAGGWGLEITGAATPRVSQPRPARLEVFRADDDIRELASSYATVRKAPDGVEAAADVTDVDGATFHVVDRWSVAGSVLSVQRRITVSGHAPGGFASSTLFEVDPAVGWSDVRYLAPGALYGDATYDGERSAGGTLNDAARRFVMREDILPAPLFALSFERGASIAVLDPAPRGETTVEESKLTQAVMTDARFQFGALGARQLEARPVEFGFWFPGSTYSYGSTRGDASSPRWIRRYHPIAPATAHGYRVAFRFGQNESFRDLTRHAWRWAWDTLKPAVVPIDVELVRRVLTDHLVAQAATIEGRTAIPFVLSTVVEQLQWNWTMAAMGFVGQEPRVR